MEKDLAKIPCKTLNAQEKETDVLQIKGLASELTHLKALICHQSLAGLIQGTDLAHPCLLNSQNIKPAKFCHSHISATIFPMISQNGPN